MVEDVELPQGGYSIHIDVATVYYDDIGFIDAGDIVQVNTMGSSCISLLYFRAEVDIIIP